MAQNNAFGQLKGKLSEEISEARDAIIKLSARAGSEKVIEN